MSYSLHNTFLYRKLAFMCLLSPLALTAQNVTDTVTWNDLDDFVIEKKRIGSFKFGDAENAFKINQTELYRAACCNLGESFTTNPSVDGTATF